MNRLAIVLLAMGVLAPNVMAKTIIAKKNGVTIQDEPKKKSQVVGELKKGEKLEASDRKGMYWSVDYKGKKAFVSAMSVRIGKSTASTGLASAIRKAAQKGREEDDSANIRTRSTVMGVRGLDESSETAFAGNVKPNLRMVYRMEEATVIPANRIRQLEDLVQGEIEKKLGS